jgi:S1-C subfamily serine protease
VTSITRPMLALIAAAGLLTAVSTATKTLAAPPTAAEPAGDYKKLIDEKSPAIVSIKFVLKMEQGEQEEETTGAVIEPTGLILSSNFSLGGMMARMGRGSATPTDLKVLIGDDTQGLKAKIVARDTELGLAWVQLDEAPAKPLTFIDFSAGTEAKLGDPIYLVSLMGKVFDRAPWVAEGRIGAVVKKPRPLLIPSFGIRGIDLSTPAYDAQGHAVGVTTFILPEQEDESQDSSGMRGITSGMILPASEVVAATARAKEMAKKGPPDAEKPADAKDDKATDKPKEGDKPKAPDAPKPAPPK